MSGNDEYSAIVMDHFKNPRNVGRIDNANGFSRVGNPTCGDMMDIYIKVKINKEGEEYIDDIKWQTFGCGAAIANTSILSEAAKGKTLKSLLMRGETEKRRENDLKEAVIKLLGGLPEIKKHCSTMASKGLYGAIENYFSQKEKQEEKTEEQVVGGEHEH